MGRGRAVAGGVCGKDRASSGPFTRNGARALKSEPRRGRTGRARGPGRRRRHRGSGAALGRGCPACPREWDQWLGARSGKVPNTTTPSSFWSLAGVCAGVCVGGWVFPRFKKRGAGWGPSGASRGTATPPSAGAHGALEATRLGTFYPRHRRVWTLLQKFCGSFSKQCQCRCQLHGVPQAGPLGVAVYWSSSNLFPPVGAMWDQQNRGGPLSRL